MTDTNNARKFRLRCTYVKQGRLAYLSHLEVARALERCVRRAGLPFAVSQGFSPHMLLHFGSALPVGIGSTCEIFDLTLRDYVSPAKALQALQGACVRDLAVKSCKYVDNSAPAASVAFPISTYEVVLSTTPPKFEFPEEITLIKKKKERVMRPDDFLVGDVCLEPLKEACAAGSEESARESVSVAGVAAGEEARAAGDASAASAEESTPAKLTFSLIAKPTGSMRPDKLLQATLCQYPENNISIKTFTRISQAEN